MSADNAVQHMARNGLDAEFWAGLAEGELRLPICAACNEWIWPAQPRCADCGSTLIESRAVEPSGTIYSWTRTHYPFVDVRNDELPYVVLLVELPHAGSVRVLGQYGGDQSDDIEIGRRVRGSVAAPSPQTFGLPAIVWHLEAAPVETAAGT